MTEQQENEGCVLNEYPVREESGAQTVVKAYSLDEAIEQAEEWVSEGAYDVETKTFYVPAWVTDTDGEEHEIKIRFDPEEPECSGEYPDVHDWSDDYELVGGIRENPGVWGHGGGIIIVVQCKICGMRRKTDTWGQGENGEQGVEIISYEAKQNDEEE